MIEAFPLQWPAGYKRTPPGKRIFSRFEQKPEKAQDFLRLEIQRMNAKDLIISSNVLTRSDGYIYSDQANSKIEDPGVAIYFKWNGKDISMCCDQYLKPWENLYALAKGIEALRGMERWGVSDFLERAFTGFKALPETIIGISCWQLLNLQPTKDKKLIEETYKALAWKAHPDRGGSNKQFSQLRTAYNQALQYAG